MQRHLTNKLNRELEQRMHRAALERQADNVVPPFPAPPPAPPPDVIADAEDMEQLNAETPNEDATSIQAVHDTLTNAYSTIKNLARELNGRKSLTETQLKDLGIVSDWLYVTKAIATRYVETLAQMERSLGELQQKSEEYYIEHGERPNL
jgi:uncharacterized protein YjiS (DUF1127 family)